jgi:hypothetical protein
LWISHLITNLGTNVWKHKIHVFFFHGINQQKCLFLCYCHYMTTANSATEYMSMLAEIWHQTGLLNCLYWAILNGVDCSLSVWLVWFGLVWCALVWLQPKMYSGFMLCFSLSILKWKFYQVPFVCSR